MDSLKMQIKELERTHSLENTKSLEKVKELQSIIVNLNKEKNAAVENLESEAKSVALLNKHIEIQDFEIVSLKKDVKTLEQEKDSTEKEHQAAVDSLNKTYSSNKERFETNFSAELDLIKKDEKLLQLEKEKNENLAILKKEVGSQILEHEYRQI